MNILIMRHAEAQSLADSDRERHLTENGRLQIRKAVECLLSLQLSFDQLWVSPYLRTQQSADELISVMGRVKRLTKSFLVPEGNPNSVVEAIEREAPQNLLIVSHQPLVSALVGLLVEADPRFGSPMSPASMAYISADVVLPGCCTLSWLRHAPNFDINK